jgi:hypothetical protein
MIQWSEKAKRAFALLLPASLSALAAGYFFILFFALANERITRKEWALTLGIMGIALFLAAGLFFFANLSYKLSAAALALALAASAGLLAGKILPYPDSIFFLTRIDARILDLEPGTEVELVWAYWAEAPDAEALESGKLLRLADISFADFSENGNWTTTAEGILFSSEQDASLTLRNIGLHRHVPALWFRSRNGAALILLDTNGKQSFHRLNGLDQDPNLLLELRPSPINRLISLTLSLLACAALLFPCFDFIVSLFCRKGRTV